MREHIVDAALRKQVAQWTRRALGDLPEVNAESSKELPAPGKRRSSAMLMPFTTSRHPCDLKDDVLLQQARAGDHGAFAILVDRYSVLLLRLISRLVRDEQLAHDVLQQVLLQFYLSLSTLRSGETLKAWLCQVARYRSLDERRRKRPLCFSEMAPRQEEEELSLLSMVPDPGPLPDELSEFHELRRQIRAGIEALPARYRTVVRLRCDAHQTFREIGLALGIPVSTAKSYFFRARQLLRTAVDPEYSNTLQSVREAR